MHLVLEAIPFVCLVKLPFDTTFPIQVRASPAGGLAILCGHVNTLERRVLRLDHSHLASKHVAYHGSSTAAVVSAQCAGDPVGCRSSRQDDLDSSGFHGREHKVRLVFGTVHRHGGPGLLSSKCPCLCACPGTTVSNGGHCGQASRPIHSAWASHLTSNCPGGGNPQFDVSLATHSTLASLCQRAGYRRDSR